MPTTIWNSLICIALMLEEKQRIMLLITSQTCRSLFRLSRWTGSLLKRHLDSSLCSDKNAHYHDNLIFKAASQQLTNWVSSLFDHQTQIQTPMRQRTMRILILQHDQSCHSISQLGRQVDPLHKNKNVASFLALSSSSSSFAYAHRRSW